jgi:predicted RNA-binding protein with TRAM domain
MTHKNRIAGAAFTLALAALVLFVPGCTPGDKPLPEVEGVSAVLGPASQDNVINTTVVSWTAGTDSRIDGYVIYRAEQGIGATVGDKSEFVLQALTFATQYVDDDVHTSAMYPTMRYFYQVAIIDAEGNLGPMSPEVIVEYPSQN